MGFRPLYLLAGLFAALSIAGWIAQFSGWLGGHIYVRGPLWHAHEMIFGFAMAVIVGFMFTAVPNWTQRPTPSGMKLAAITCLWLAGRLFILTPWPMLAAAADTGFAIAAAAGIAVPLYASGKSRNYFFVALLLALGGANLAFHLAMAQFIDFKPQLSLQAGMDIILIMMAVMGGRVIPMFTANATPGMQLQRDPRIEFVALGSLVLLAITSLTPAPPTVVGALAVIAALSHVIRLVSWQPWRTAGNPMLWILHVSYAWIVMHLLLRGLSIYGFVSASAATHALTVGAIGGLTLGMMTRTARGHTGHPLQAGRAETAAYILVQLAAAIRTFLPIAAPALYLWSINISGMLWASAFLLFCWRFAPILSQARADGKAG